MALEHKIRIAAEHFNIGKPEDWQHIRPEWIRQVHNVGPRTLDHIRLYLAMRGLTLQDDATPAFWQQNLQTARIGGQVSLVDKADVEEFTVLIDQQEKHPWTFQGFERDGRPVIVPYRWQSLGPSHGDYSVSGCEGMVHIERKSIDDALGTFLSHGERRDRWVRTLEYLATIDSGHVIVEGTHGQCLASIQPHGKRGVIPLRNEFMGSVISWAGTYQVPFWFMDNRRLAERLAWKIMRRHWRRHTEQRSTPRPAADVIAELC
ncbi:hypothetical protein [Crateriforma conspicua]|uniref:ERCC4 domain-containing protein n=1 Tax=Crateriforma conspicua TaxID=2527996 RepID=A0A5C5XVL1_9PLAN|nr:hypothetical protein [Crateriforma conspicua]TWT65642.1 hypothetical protein Pan14r_51890 [Crateriforma conspicua]